MRSTSSPWFPFAFTVLACTLGCGSEPDNPLKQVTSSGADGGVTPPDGGDGGGGGGGMPPDATPAAPVIDLVVDANRDGVANPDDPADQDREDEWDAKSGASFLANLDDDDDNDVRDVDDEVVNGPADEADLATILVRTSPDAPEGATGVLEIDALSAENVRLWKKGLDGNWTIIAGSLGPCSNDTSPCQIVPQANLSLDEVRAGVSLGIEGRRFRVSAKEGAWTGMVDLAYSIHDKDNAIIKTDQNPDGFDRVKMRVAPWMLFGNLSAFSTAYAESYDKNFVAQLDVLLSKAGLTFKKITNYPDQWVQDYFQTAWTSIPGPGGTVRGMRVYNPRPWAQPGNTLPIKWLMKNMLGPDQAVVQIYAKANSGDSYDSHGNHDLLPPYTNGTETFPHGRIIIGSGILSETRDFYAAQSLQAPALRVNTSWLLVGHVDEVFSYVPAQTPRGWKLLVGSPRLARTMLEKATADGFGATEMFVGKNWYGGKSAAISIDAVLADPDLMTESQQAQTAIDAMVEIVRKDVGLADDEIIEVPYLFEQDSGALVAYNPGTANLLAFGDYVVHADPFGPQINGADLFKKDLEDRLGTPINELGSEGKGLFVNFADDWNLYHILLGEVHCGSNVDGPPPANEKWWEAGR